MSLRRPTSDCEPRADGAGEEVWSMRRPVFCAVRSRREAEKVVDRLRAAGFDAADVSLVSPDVEANVVHERHTKAPEGAVTGAGTLGLVGGAFGWLVGAGALAIPGLGPFVAAGPIMAALAGGAVGAAVGGVAGGLAGLGIPEIEARQCEERLRDAQILIAVHADDPAARARAGAVFRRSEAECIIYEDDAGVV